MEADTDRDVVFRDRRGRSGPDLRRRHRRRTADGLTRPRSGSWTSISSTRQRRRFIADPGKREAPWTPRMTSLVPRGTSRAVARAVPRTHVVPRGTMRALRRSRPRVTRRVLVPRGAPHLRGGSGARLVAAGGRHATERPGCRGGSSTDAPGGPSTRSWTGAPARPSATRPCRPGSWVGTSTIRLSDALVAAGAPQSVGAPRTAQQHLAGGLAAHDAEDRFGRDVPIARKCASDDGRRGAPSPTGRSPQRDRGIQ